MFIESFLTKIVAALFKKAAASVIAAVGTAIEIYSVIDTISDLTDVVSSTNDCYDLATVGLEVVSNPLSEAAIDKLLSVGSDTYTVEKLSSGIYIASRFTTPFKANLHFPKFEPPTLTKPDFKPIVTPRFPNFKRGN